MRAIAADAHAERARRASLPLRLPHRMQKALADAFQIAVRAAQMFQIRGQRILDVLVLAAAALQDQLHFDLILLPLLEVDHRSFGAQIVAAVLAGERIHRIRAQLAALGRLRHRFANRLLDRDLIHAHRRVHIERRHAGVLADRAVVLGGHVDVRRDNVQRLRGLRVRRLRSTGRGHRRAHVGRQIRGRLGDQLDEAVLEKLHGEALSYCSALTCRQQPRQPAWRNTSG